MIKRVLLTTAALIVALTACSSIKVSDAYTASGDGIKPSELKRTTQFSPTDDLNVVVTLGVHNHTVPVYAIFTSPTGAVYQTDSLDAKRTVGEIVLGLDWDTQAIGSWPTGQWKVDIYVDKTKAKTLKFTVG